jgi:hypothetical protein
MEYTPCSEVYFCIALPTLRSRIKMSELHNAYERNQTKHTKIKKQSS